MSHFIWGSLTNCPLRTNGLLLESSIFVLLSLLKFELGCIWGLNLVVEFCCSELNFCIGFCTGGKFEFDEFVLLVSSNDNDNLGLSSSTTYLNWNRIKKIAALHSMNLKLVMSHIKWKVIIVTFTVFLYLFSLFWYVT